MRVHRSLSVCAATSTFALAALACGSPGDTIGSSTAADLACPEYRRGHGRVVLQATIDVDPDVRALLEASFTTGQAATSLVSALTQECIAFAIDLGAPNTWSSAGAGASMMNAACAAVVGQLGVMTAAPEHVRPGHVAAARVLAARGRSGRVRGAMPPGTSLHEHRQEPSVARGWNLGVVRRALQRNVHRVRPAADHRLSWELHRELQ